jgi:hypothetical protein
MIQLQLVVVIVHAMLVAKIHVVEGVHVLDVDSFTFFYISFIRKLHKQIKL